MLESSQYACAEQFAAFIAGNAAARLVIASTRPFEASSAEMEAWTRIISALHIADNDYAFVSQCPRKQGASATAGVSATSGASANAADQNGAALQNQACEQAQQPTHDVPLHAQNQDAGLHARQLVKVVEGIDPIAIVCCDEAFFSQLKAGYAQAPATENHTNQFAELIQAMPELRVLAPSLTQTPNPTARDVPVCKIYANEQGEYLRLFGRPCIALRNFGAALASQHAKQQVWSLIKQLEPLLASHA